MREVVVSSEDLDDARGGGIKISEEDDENGLRNGMIRWENLFPRMILRVLLVESDDSTRQIVAALLRKCSYRVAAVSDGLKAWEVLKGRPGNIDLILTEVDLPSISGYALLTLIMEHDVCKNIPVIMMSCHDSVNTVYKCMLRGAADYLVKPLRRNELRNLWQHVWRRQSSIVGSTPLTTRDKGEGTSENYASEDLTVQRCKDYIEKGSDDLSSCTKPEMDAESALPGAVDDSNGRREAQTSILEINVDEANEGERQPELAVRTRLQPHLLEQSLCVEKQGCEEKNTLIHSSGSAFTRYTSKLVHPAVANHSELELNDEDSKRFNLVTSATEGMAFNYGSIFRSVFSKQASESPSPSPHSAGECTRNTNDSSNQTPAKEHGRDADQIATSSFCNSVGNHQADENTFRPGASSRLSSQREAALMKFRMKRKERCYEKKVRYESRKKLAEQRPRVKGQFVRQHETSQPSKVTN